MFFSSFPAVCSCIFKCDRLHGIVFTLVYIFYCRITIHRQYVSICCDKLFVHQTPPINVIRFGKSSKLKIGFRTLTESIHRKIQKKNTYTHEYSLQYTRFFYFKCVKLSVEFDGTLIELVSLLANIMRISIVNSFPFF